MFIHISKDYMKKLDDVDSRLAVSLDKDEIQTLGLKLRFYHNEIRHYKSLLDDIQKRILDVQTRFGFAVDSAEYSPAKPQPPDQAEELSRAVQRSQQAEPPQNNVAEQQTEKPRGTLKMLNEWVSQLEEQGRNPQEILTRAAVHYKEQTPAGHIPIDINLPEEGGSFAEEPAQTRIGEPTIENTPMASSPAPFKSFDDHLARLAALLGNSEETSGKLAAELERALEDRRAEATFGLDRISTGNKELLEEEGFGPLLFCWGYLAHRTGRNGLAINLLTQAVGKGAAWSLCYLTLARCSLAKNLHEKALINFNFASRINPALAEARIGAAQCLTLMGNPEKALEQLETEKFESTQFQNEATLLRADALEKLNRTAEAAKLLSTAAATCQNPGDRATMLFTLGKTFEKAGDVIKAIENYEAALDCSPDNMEVRYNLGRIYLSHKAFPLAREQFNFIIKKFPDSEWADRARELI